MNRGSAAVAVVAAGWLAALVITWPLALRVDRAVATPDVECEERHCPDTLLSTWIVVEGSRRLRDSPSRLLEGGIFHPMRHTLAYSEMGFALAAFAAPVDALTRNPILAYNAAYLSTYALTFVGVFLVVWHVTRDWRAATLAGLVAAWGPASWRFRGHPFALGVHWVPFALHAVLLQLERPSIFRVAWIAGTILLVAHSCAYYGLVVPILLSTWTGALLVTSRPRNARAWAGVVIGIAVGVTLTALTYWPYLLVREEVQPRLIGYFPALSAWYSAALASPRRYLGSLLATRDAHAAPLLPYALVVAAFLVASLRRSVARSCGGAVSCLRHLTAAAVVALTAALLSLGPEPHLPRVATLLVRSLAGLPGFDTMRGTYRFVLLFQLAMAIATGLAIATLLSRIRTGAMRRAIVATLAIVVVVESRVALAPLPLTTLGGAGDLPRVYSWLRGTPPGTAVVEFPAGEWTAQTRYMIAALYHGRPIANGYSAVRPGLGAHLGAFPSEPTRELLADAGVEYALLHAEALRRTRAGATMLARVEGDTSFEPQWIDDVLVARIPARPPPTLPRDPPIPRDAWTIEPAFHAAADGDLATHWHADGTRASLRVRLRDPRVVSAVVLRLGPHLGEAPRRFHARTSPDGDRWYPVGDGRVRAPLWSYRRDHRDVSVTLALRPTTTQVLELDLEASWDRRLPLGIHDLVLHGPPPHRRAINSG